MKPNTRWIGSLAATLSLALGGAAAGAPQEGAKSAGEVVLYYAADEPIARLVIDAFEKQTGIHVKGVGDNEAVKAIGLAQRLRSEKDAPRCDVFWNSEPFLTINLADEGLLAPHDSPAASERPESMRGASRLWHGFAQRARVLVYNTKSPPNIGTPDAPALPQRLRELQRPTFSKGTLVMARPFAGTTRSHMAVLASLWGEDGAQAWAGQMAFQKIRLLSGNANVVESVANQEAIAGLCDSDDVWAGKRNGWPVEMVALRHDKMNMRNEVEIPMGALLLPNTAAKIKGGPNPDNGAKLVDFLLSAEVERMLAKSDSHNIPVRPEVAKEFPELGVADAMTLDLAKIARGSEQALKIFEEAFPE